MPKIEIPCFDAEIRRSENGCILIYANGVDYRYLLDKITDNMPINDVLGVYDICVIKEYIRRKEDDKQNNN